MSFMATYKPGQGKQARTFVSLLIVLIAAWGCYAFLEYGNSKLDRLLGFESQKFAAPILGTDISLTSWVSWSLILSLGLFVAVFFWARRYLNKPKVADHLIGTELELRRVVWPTKAQVAKSGALVVYYTALLALLIFILDLDMATLVYGFILGQDHVHHGWGKFFEIFGIYELTGLHKAANGWALTIIISLILAVQVLWGLRLWFQRQQAQEEAGE